MRADNKRRALTLIELLAVLVILSILTVVAVQSTDVMIDQARFDSTQKVIQAIEDSILGPYNARDADGTLYATGFVADMGRLPSSIEELYTEPSDPAELLTLRGTSDPQVKLLCGYRRDGYINRPRKLDGTFDILRDGWGNSIDLDTVGMPPNVVTRIVSLGANGVANGVGYDADHIRPLARHVTTVTGTLSLLDANGDLRAAASPPIIVLYQPGNPPAENTISPTATVTPGLYTFSVPATIGQRIIRAYEGTPLTATKKSRVISFVATSNPRSLEITIQP